MSGLRIKQINNLLTERLHEDHEILDIKETDFLGKGENYGSTLFRVDISIRNKKTNEEEVISTVAKTLPPTEELKQIFNIQETVSKEIAFYNVVVPRLQQFLDESGVDIRLDMFPTLHGGRLNLNGSEVVDEDSVILLENLIAKGFMNADRQEGFDYETAKVIIQDLAIFHAVPLAMKLKQPDVFDSDIRKYLKPGLTPPPPPPEHSDEMGPDKVILEILYQNDKCLPHTLKVAGLFRSKLGSPSHNPREPWGTIVHTDLWVNNILVKHDNGKPVDNKIVDFQLYTYDSGIKDLLFLMFTSFENGVLEESVDELLKFYHDTFIGVLLKLGVDTKPFSYDLFLKEVDHIATDEVLHVLLFLPIVLAPKSSEGTFLKLEDILKHMNLKCKEKIWLVVLDSARRKWL